jgi:ribosomal protein L11 methyltransferase
MRLIGLVVPAADADAAADRLWVAGATAVEELAGESGTVVVRTVLAADDQTSLGRLGPVPASWQIVFSDADDAPSEAWRDHARPIVVNDGLVLVPAWVPADTADAVVITIEPAGSFGLGDHPTTRLSADAVWRLTQPDDRVLDVGCGTGVLAIIALHRGAAHAVAIDIAEAAREATLANAAANGVSEGIEASCTPLADVDGEFDLIAANILAPTLVELADDLRRVLAPGGRLVISGILADRHEHVLAALAPLRVVATSTLDAWACVELVSPTD